jgi:EXPERA (EXPanded EBP superfamily)
MLRAMATPLSRRPGDFVFIGFFVINLFFVTYIVDIEQLTVANPFHFTYPLWPPRPFVDMVHWWGRNFDPALMAREPWWRATIWIDALGFGPFYVFAIYAFVKGRDWIRIPCFIWAGMMFSNVVIILFEEFIGRHPTPRPGIMLAANLPWLLFPMFVVLRMALRERPFSELRK